MTWGVFDQSISIHIIPCDENGAILYPHTINEFCYCHPTCVETKENERLIINHNQIN